MRPAGVRGGSTGGGLRARAVGRRVARQRVAVGTMAGRAHSAPSRVMPGPCPARKERVAAGGGSSPGAAAGPRRTTGPRASSEKPTGKSKRNPTPENSLSIEFNMSELDGHTIFWRLARSVLASGSLGCGVWLARLWRLARSVVASVSLGRSRRLGRSSSSGWPRPLASRLMRVSGCGRFGQSAEGANRTRSGREGLAVGVHRRPPRPWVLNTPILLGPLSPPPRRTVVDGAGQPRSVLPEGPTPPQARATCQRSGPQLQAQTPKKRPGMPVSLTPETSLSIAFHPSELR
jgi:hypothetical protein